MPESLQHHVAVCRHPACVATRELKEHGANLILGKGRHCELAVLAAAGADGMTDRDIVVARRKYAEHLGVSLAGRTTGEVADSAHAIHARHAAEGNVVGMPDAKHPIPLGSARVSRVASSLGESFDVYRLNW